MPTYTYECKKCGHTQMEFHGMNAKPRIKCAECGGSCKKLLGTGAGLIFKGSGFYETDYKRSGEKAGASGKDGDGAAKSDAAKSETSKSESSKSESSSTKKASDKTSGSKTSKSGD